MKTAGTKFAKLTKTITQQLLGARRAREHPLLLRQPWYSSFPHWGPKLIIKFEHAWPALKRLVRHVRWNLYNRQQLNPTRYPTRSSVLGQLPARVRTSPTGYNGLPVVCIEAETNTCRVTNYPMQAFHHHAPQSTTQQHNRARGTASGTELYYTHTTQITSTSNSAAGSVTPPRSTCSVPTLPLLALWMFPPVGSSKTTSWLDEDGVAS